MSAKYRTMSAKHLISVAALAAFTTASAHAQWTVTNLHPAGALWSEAWGASGANQVGFAWVGGTWRASLWTGTAASWVDLHPAGASESFAYGASGANQVGFARVGGIRRASLWTGSAGSWVNLHPAGATSSWAFGASGANQVGAAYVGGNWRASLWTGTAASWFNLHALLPAEFSWSEARSITTDGALIHIAGWGYNTATGRIEALLWTIPEPGTLLLLGAGLAGLAARRRRSAPRCAPANRPSSRWA